MSSGNNITPQPPARTPTHSAPLTLPDPRNTISHPEGPQYSLLLSEGAYTLRDEILLGPIPPHPSEIGVSAPNVLDTKPVVPTAGTRLSIAVLAPRRPPSQLRRRPFTPSSASKSSFPSSSAENTQESSHSSGDQSTSRFSGFGLPGFRSKTNDPDGAVAVPNGKELKDPSKRKKPKSSITKSNSSFISRAIPNESLSKRLSEHQLDGDFTIVNINRAMMWLDLSSSTKQDPLMKILFNKAHALCHDFNETSKTPAHMDIIMGFSTSEVLWYEPMSQRYSRINKNGVINSSAITDIKWIPGSENLFIAAHFDGSLVIYDKEKDDAPCTFEEEVHTPTKILKNGRRAPRLLIRKPVHSKGEKTNPISVWKATNQRVNGMEFSPDGKLLALVSEDGTLRILDYEKEVLLSLYSSYYGGLTCVAWSPDGAYVITGGQDDLISIWSMAERTLVARCVGHRSWVAKVAFDPWRCDEITYRFGSVGEDGRLLLWDFSVGTLNRPRAVSGATDKPAFEPLLEAEPVLRKTLQASVQRSISSFVPPGADRSNSVATITPETVEASAPRPSSEEDDGLSHPFVPRGQVATLPPVLSKEVDIHALSWIRFEEDYIIVSCRAGHIRTWDRPTAELGEEISSAAPNVPDPMH